MICTVCNYAIVCPDCQAKDHPKRKGHKVDNVQDFLDEMAEAPEEKRNRLLAMKAAIEGQMASVLKEKQQIDQLVGNGQQEVAKEAATVLDGYKKTSDFARQKIVTSLSGLQTQRNLCDYYIGVISALGDKGKLATQFTPEQCAQMIQQWGQVEKNLAQPGEACNRAWPSSSPRRTSSCRCTTRSSADSRASRPLGSSTPSATRRL
jgi:hypothetical protein